MGAKRVSIVAGGVLVGAAVFAALALAVGLAGNARESEADLQRVMWQTKTASTQAERYRTISALSPRLVCTNTPVSLTVSLQLRGAPVQVRVMRDGVRQAKQLPRRPLKPGAIRLNPSRGGSPTTFTFIDPSRGAGALSYKLQWRSLTGGKVSASGASVVAHFGRAPGQGCPD